jgi:transcriptional regulator with XRE-family HTH domain
MAGRKKKDQTDPKPTVDLSRSFGPALRHWRKKRGYSQEKLAVRADIHPTEIGLLERGQREPRLGIIAKLSGALGISPSALFAGLDFVPSEDGHGQFNYELPPPPAD